MTDVAAAAGVSLKTVSRVVNAEPGVTPETAARVREAIEQLGFRRNYVARALRRGQRFRMLGLVIEDVANPFYSAIARGVEEATRERGQLLITGSSDEDPERERELVLLFCERRVDGLLIVPAGDDHGYLVPELRAGMHVVFIDRPPGNIDADAVLLDNAGGARAATEHLLRRGHRRIAMVVDHMTIFTQRERWRGFCDALAAAGQTVDDTLVRFGVHDAADGGAGRRRAAVAVRARRRRSSPPTTGSRSASCARSPRTAPTLEVVGFDDLELAELLARPPTTVSYDAADLGREAAGLLAGRLEGDDAPAAARDPADGARRPRRAGGRRMKPIRLAANQPRRFYRGGEAIARFRGDGDRRRPRPRGLGRLDDGDPRLGAARPDDAAGRPPAARRGRRRSRALSRRRSTSPRSGPIRPSSSSCSTPASACPSTCTPTAPSRASTSARRTGSRRHGSCCTAAPSISASATSRRRHPARLVRRRRTSAAMLAASNELQVGPGDCVYVPGGDAARDRRGRLHGRGAGALGPRRHARVAGVRAARVGDDGPRARHGARRDPPQRGLPRRDRVVDAAERGRARAAAGRARGRPAGGGAVLPRGVAPARSRRSSSSRPSPSSSPSRAPAASPPTRASSSSRAATPSSSRTPPAPAS